jgi:hypothetical protein
MEYRATRYKLALPRFSTEMHMSMASVSTALYGAFSPSQRKISLQSQGAEKLNALILGRIDA